VNNLTANWLLSLPEQTRSQFLKSLSPDEKAQLFFRWSFWARPNQIHPDGDWRTWLVKAGRGFGKTRTGAEWVRWRIEQCGRRRIALVGATAADARDVMVEGESGLMSVCPPWNRPLYEPSKRRVTWPNGAMATTYSADEPERLRGPQHDDAWTDEIAAWRYEDTWDNLMFGLRLGDDPRVCATTTPKPVKLVKELIKAPTTVITGGSTYENKSNLAGPFLEQIVKKYEGTRLGRQELEAQLLDDNPDALWKRQAMIEAHRKTIAIEEFEKWAESEGYPLDLDEGGYFTRTPYPRYSEKATETAFTVWMASRENDRSKS
jgi:phage terminase large subunit-like protein